LVFRNILRRLRGDLVGTVAEVIVSTCNATFHSKCVHKTTLLHNSIANQHSYNILVTYQSERSELNLDRVLRGQPIKISYLLRVTTELIGNSEGLVD
jgi:hypothetical protein